MDVKCKWSKFDLYTKYTILVLLISLFVRFSLAFTSRISGDTCWHSNIAKYIATTGTIPLFEHLGRDFFWAPPLFHLLSSFMYKLFGWLIGDFAFNILPPIFGTFMLLFSFLVMKKLFTTKIAFYSTLFFSFIPITMSVSSTPYVDTLLGSLVLASIYYALEKRLIFSSILMGFAFLTKYNAIFAIPVLVYIIYSNSHVKRQFLKHIILFLSIVIFISSIWLLRNYYIFANPVWPFFNNVFQGYPTVDKTTINFGITDFLRFYLEMFGVPEGKFSTLQMINNDFLISLWLLMTAIFILPFFIGLKNIRNKRSFNIVNIFLLFFIIQQIFVYLYAGFISPRWMLVAFASISIYWAFGFDCILSWLKRYNFVLFILLGLLLLGFVSAQIVRNNYANNLWNPYQEDFDWIKENTEKDALILTPPGQCYSFNLNRFTVTTKYCNENRVLITDEYIDENINYIFSTKKSIVTSSFNKTMINKFSKYKIIYTNNRTGTVVYKV